MAETVTPKELAELSRQMIAAIDVVRRSFEDLKIDNGALRVSDVYRISPEGGPTLVVSSTVAFTDQLAPGLYHITSDTAGVFIAIGSSPTVGTGGHDYRLVADGVFGPVEILEGERIAAIIAAGTANLYYHRVR